MWNSNFLSVFFSSVLRLRHSPLKKASSLASLRQRSSLSTYRSMLANFSCSPTNSLLMWSMILRNVFRKCCSVLSLNSKLSASKVSMLNMIWLCSCFRLSKGSSCSYSPINYFIKRGVKTLIIPQNKSSQLTLKLIIELNIQVLLHQVLFSSMRDLQSSTVLAWISSAMRTIESNQGYAHHVPGARLIAPWLIAPWLQHHGKTGYFLVSNSRVHLDSGPKSIESLQTVFPLFQQVIDRIICLFYQLWPPRRIPTGLCTCNRCTARQPPSQLPQHVEEHLQCFGGVVVVEQSQELVSVLNVILKGVNVFLQFLLLEVIFQRRGLCSCTDTLQIIEAFYLDCSHRVSQLNPQPLAEPPLIELLMQSLTAKQQRYTIPTLYRTNDNSNSDLINRLNYYLFQDSIVSFVKHPNHMFRNVRLDSFRNNSCQRSIKSINIF